MSSTEIILNRANVALARSQRLVASWLPPQTTEEQSSNTKSEEELQREEDEIFTAVPETLGVGAPLPSKLPDGSWNRAELDSNDALRRQLLGRNYQNVMKEKEREREREARQRASAANASANGDANNSKSGVNNEAVEEDSYDEEDGRTVAVGRKFVKGQGQGQGLTKNQKKKNNKKRKAAEEQAQSETAAAAAASGDSLDQEGQEVEAQGDDQEGSSAKQDAGTSGSSSRPASRRKKATSFLDEILAERSKKRKER
ncbi:DUF3245 domain-containing protein [Aspergillus chevalieri]|uniref:Uncharacterized protein n=1 Tax=Aspergillus chevalieri TaxID=182096 RepID=A0A7R7VNA5_ASPCH|nr:uncharacterized protein ACHE_31055A [Aspergillus chevalieri]BCR87068.1 hypothetical protein ACHE_31055A [Aspergillus chevalieri]